MATNQNPAVRDLWEEYSVTDPATGAVSVGSRKVGTFVESTATLVDNPPASGSTANATDAAKELAKENGIDLATITGTGKDGVITKPDVEAAIEAKGKASS